MILVLADACMLNLAVLHVATSLPLNTVYLSTRQLVS